MARPLHRSPVALRADTGALAGAAGAAGAFVVALVLAGALAGAVELENTVCLPWLVTPAVAPFWRAVNGDGAAVGAGTRGEATTRGLVVPVAPLVDLVAEAPVVFTPIATGGCAVGGGAGGAPDGGVMAVGGVAAGVAGVPKPDGVQAHARPAPIAAIPRTESTAKLNVPARLCTGQPFHPFEGHK